MSSLFIILAQIACTIVLFWNCPKEYIWVAAGFMLISFGLDGIENAIKQK